MASHRDTDRCTVQAPAKLNLCLELLGRRDDGYHDLRTVMTTVRLSDTLRVEAAPGDAIRLEVDGPDVGADVPVDRTNLVVRALESLRESAGVSRGMTARLFKRIPSQAGLGGGSSDAAAALVAGDAAWGLGLPTARLAEIGATLGSDVPFFVHAIGSRRRGVRAEAALCTGRGERVDPIAAPGGLPCVVVKPGASLSTATVFGACRPADYEAGRNRSDRVASLLLSGRWRRIGDAMQNTLHTAALRVAPALRRLQDFFDRLPVIGHLLSGSGSAYYAICRSVDQARQVGAVARSSRLGRVWVTSTG